MATVQTQENASSDVWPGGQVQLECQFETYLNSGQACTASGVTISIAAAQGGTGTGTPVTSAVPQQLGTLGLYSYTWSPAESLPAGDYLATWTGTRTSDNSQVSYTQCVTVVNPPAPTPSPGMYATVQQYRDETGDTWTPQAMVTAVLKKASRDIDRACVAAVYRVDADGLPQDAVVADCLMRATCAQAEYRAAHNDPAGVKFEYSSSNVGGVSAVRAPSMTGMAFFPIAPDALTILRVDGVLPAAPLVNW